MMTSAARQYVQLFRVYDGMYRNQSYKSALLMGCARADANQIAAIARTISQCFSNDTLIQWLRPGCTPWSRNGVEQAWQRRRIQRAVFEGEVFCSNITEEWDATSSSCKGAWSSIQETSWKDSSRAIDAGVAIMLYPPKERQNYSWRRLWQGLKIWVLDRLTPTPDDGSRYEVWHFDKASDRDR